MIQLMKMTFGFNKTLVKGICMENKRSVVEVSFGNGAPTYFRVLGLAYCGSSNRTSFFRYKVMHRHWWGNFYTV